MKLRYVLSCSSSDVILTLKPATDRVIIFLDYSETGCTFFSSFLRASLFRPGGLVLGESTSPLLCLSVKIS